MNEIKFLSVVSPVYKSAECVEVLYQRIQDSLKKFRDNLCYEIIFVEDCGQDGSWEKIHDLALKEPRLKAIKLSRNFGQHSAITAGLNAAMGDWVVVLDCDLQDPPEEIPRLLHKAMEGYDMVCARRRQRQDSFWRRSASRIFISILNWFSGMAYDSQIANFRVISRSVVDAYSQMGETPPSFGGQLEWLGFHVGYIDIQHQSRYQGRSSYSFSKLLKVAMRLIVAYSNKPLYVSISVGFFMSFLSIIYALYITLRKFFIGTNIDGWASLMVSVWFLSGLLIGNLGIIGLYLGKVYDEVKRRPVYVIAESVNLGSNESTDRKRGKQGI